MRSAQRPLVCVATSPAAAKDGHDASGGGARFDICGADRIAPGAVSPGERSLHRGSPRCSLIPWQLGERRPLRGWEQLHHQEGEAPSAEALAREKSRGDPRAGPGGVSIGTVVAGGELDADTKPLGGLARRGRHSRGGGVYELLLDELLNVCETAAVAERVGQRASRNEGGNGVGSSPHLRWRRREVR